MSHTKLNEARRRTLKFAGGMIGGLAAAPLLSLWSKPTEAAWAKLPMENVPPEEIFETTVKRLFGGRPIEYNNTKVVLTVPNVAENGAVVPTLVEAALGIEGKNYVRNIYLIVDKNKRPHAVTYAFTPETGMGRAAANLRLGGTSWVHAVVEMDDKTLIAAKSEVKVVVGGCGG